MPHLFPIERYLNVRAASSPSFSPDGRFVAYISNTTGIPQVWLIPSAGGEPTQLTFGADAVRGVHFSPMRHELVFSMDAGGNERTQLYRLYGVGGGTDHAIGDAWDFENLTNDPKAIHSFGGWSHDGTRIAYSANRQDQSRFDIYIQDVVSGEKKSAAPKLLARGPGGYYSAAGWSPDDKFILVERTDSNVNQDLYVVEVATGKVRHLTPHKGDVQYRSSEWSHDGKKVYCVSTYGGRDLTQVAELDVKSGKISFPGDVEHEVERVVASPTGNYVCIFDNADGRSRLRLHNLKDQKQTVFGSVPLGVASAAEFSHDGRHVALALDGPRHNPDIWTIDLAKLKADLERPNLPGGSTNPADSDKLVGRINKTIKEVRRLSRSDTSPSQFFEEFLDKTVAGIEAPAGAVWIKNLQGFLQLQCQINIDNVGIDRHKNGRQTHNELLRQAFQTAKPILLEPFGSTGILEGIPAGNPSDYVVLLAPILLDEKTPVGLVEVWQEPRWEARAKRIHLNYLVQMAGYASTYVKTQQGPQTSSHKPDFFQLTHSGRAGLPFSEFVEPELIRYKSFDGREIPAWWYAAQTPLADAGGSPVIVYPHGGPESQTRPNFTALFQFFLARGYSILAPNVRGSSGYGSAFMNLDNTTKRMDSVADLAHAAHWIKDQKKGDPKRIAVYGGSYGGFMVLAALTHYPDLWAAGIDVVGIANFVTFLEKTGDWRRAHREKEYGNLREHRDFLVSISPLNHVDKIRCPLMVIHGANDPRVPVGEAEQIVTALKQRGVPVEYLRYDDEGHGLVKLKNRLDAYPKMAAFLDKYLK